MTDILEKLKALPEYDYDEGTMYLDFEGICWDDGYPQSSDVVYAGWRVTLERDKGEMCGAYGSVMMNIPDEGWTEDEDVPPEVHALCLTDLKRFASSLGELGVFISVGEDGEVTWKGGD